MGADSEPTSTILRLHGLEEKIIQESGIPYTFLRPSAFMQNFVTQFGYTIRAQNVFYVPAGNAKMSFVDTRDIAAISSKILTNNGASHYQAAEILSNVTEEDARKGMKQMGAQMTGLLMLC